MLVLTALGYPHQKCEDILQSCSVLTKERTELQFNEPLQWDIDALSIDLATWMADDNVQPATTSRVGILSSMECQALLNNYLDEDLCINFGLLVKTASLLYNRKDSPHPQYDHEQLNSIRYSAGAKLLKNLEAALKCTALAQASKGKLMGLFSVLLGTIIAITYTLTTNFEEARHELLRIIVHHMVFIGERIGLLDCDLIKQRLTEGCHNIWNKAGNFEWSYETSPAVEGVDMEAPPEQNQSCVGVSSNAIVSTERSRASIPNEDDYQPSHISNITSANDALQQVDLIHKAGPQLTTNPLPLYDWTGNSGAECGSLATAMDMTTCFLCNGRVPSDEMCPACFGPPPLTAGYNDTTLQDDFRMTSPFPEFQALDPVTTSTEAIAKSEQEDNEEGKTHGPKVTEKTFENLSSGKKQLTTTQQVVLSCRTELSFLSLGPSIGLAKKFPHRQCSPCSVSYAQPRFPGQAFWICYHCGDGPQPKPLSPQLCENINSNSVYMCCRSCSSSRSLV